MGHFCRICGRIRANKRFGGKGNRDHICEECVRLSREVREKIEIQEELHGILHQSNISAKNLARLQSLIAHPDSEIARAATVLHQLGKRYPRRRRRLVRLRRDPDLVRRLVTGLPPGMWEDYAYRFGDFLEESLPLDSDGAATSSLPFEDLSQGAEDIDPQLTWSLERAAVRSGSGLCPRRGRSRGGGGSSGPPPRVARIRVSPSTLKMATTLWSMLSFCPGAVFRILACSRCGSVPGGKVMVVSNQKFVSR